MKEFFLTANDGLKLSIGLFDIENPISLVQIIHGSVEHKERYYDFARFLNEKGFAVITSDNRGHGASLNEKYTLGFMDSFEKIVDDQFLISEYFKNMYPYKKLNLFGHSLGSVFARIYLEKHDDYINKLVISGTVKYNFAAPFGETFAKLIIDIKGERAYNKLLRALVMNDDNICWISTDTKNRELYKADTLCGYPYMNISVLTILRAVRELGEVKHYECKNPDLPILSISGEEDPVTGGPRGLEESFRLLRKIGYKYFTDIVYP